MPTEEVRFMRLLVLFDLPVTTKAERQAANRFRNFLKSDGYDMVQFSIYCRICRGRAVVEKHMTRLNGNLPSTGCVRTLQVTDLQYARMKILVGPKKKKEALASQQLLLL